MNTVTFRFKDMPGWASEWATKSEWFDRFHKHLGPTITNFNHVLGTAELYRIVCNKAPEVGINCFSVVDNQLYITIEITPELTKHILSYCD